MIGLDTNILVRYVTQDDAHQFRLVINLLNQRGAVFYVPNLVVVELDWVLTRLYNWDRDEIAETMAKLLTIHNLVFEDERKIRGALRAMRQGADFSDELIAMSTQEKGCQKFATFDKAFAKRHPQFAFLPKGP